MENTMKAILKLEELFMFILGIFLFSRLDYAWDWFWGLLLAPDLGALGYLGGTGWKCKGVDGDSVGSRQQAAVS